MEQKSQYQEVKLSILPEALGKMTINDIINNADTNYIKRGNKIVFRRATEFGIITLELATCSNNQSREWTFKSLVIDSSNISKPIKNFDYIDKIIELKKSGMLQKDIAIRLGISESYVSKLFRESNS